MFTLFIAAFVFYILFSMSWEIIKSIFSFGGFLFIIFFIYILFGGGK